jgi:hypothetical protein
VLPRWWEVLDSKNHVNYLNDERYNTVEDASVPSFEYLYSLVPYRC